MELVVAAETETGQLASDGPGPPTESPTTEGMAKTDYESHKQFFNGHLTRSVSSTCWRSAGTGFSCLLRFEKLSSLPQNGQKWISRKKFDRKAAALGENAHKATRAIYSVNKRAKLPP